MVGRVHARAIVASVLLLIALRVQATEYCQNGRDDDGDGAVDCADPDCAHGPYCSEADNCLDEWDNDNDYLFDCQDPDCATHDGCTGPENCDNDVDDDGDTLIDCAERQCPLRPSCLELNCTDGIDDEGDGYVDCMDVQCCCCLECWASPRCQPQSPGEWCANGRDDDGDGFVDCDDPDCTLACGGEVSCVNGIDDDGDGLADCLDDDCIADPACAGADSDGDAHANSADCAPSDATTWSAPAEVTGLRAGRRAEGMLLTWDDLSAQAGPSIRYDVIRGALPDLRADGSVLAAACLYNDATTTEVVDWGASGCVAACYYLVRGQNSCGDGEYGSGIPASGCR